MMSEVLRFVCTIGVTVGSCSCKDCGPIALTESMHLVENAHSRNA